MQHRLVLFTGAMFSGKSNALIIATDRARQVLPKCVAIKCKLDTRSANAAIVARTGLTLPADVITDRLATVQPQPGLLYSVDEGQFFPDLLPFWHRVVAAGAYLAVAGLDLDFRRQPFGQVLELAKAGLQSPHPVLIERFAARCTHGSSGPCGRPALYTQKLWHPPAPATAPVGPDSVIESGASAAAASGGSSLSRERETVVAVGGGDRYQPACELHHRPEPIPHDAWWSAR